MKKTTTKKTAAKRSGKGNAANTAAKWRAEVDAHASVAEISITKELPNDALGLYVRWRIAEHFATASSAGFPIDQHLADLESHEWDLFVEAMRLVEHAGDSAGIRSALEAARWTAGTWLRIRNAFDYIVNARGSGIPPPGLLDMADELLEVESRAVDVKTAVEEFIADHPAIAEVEAFSRRAEQRAERDGVNTSDAGKIREYLSCARAEYTSAATRKPFIGKYQEIPAGKIDMLDEMRADGNEVGEALVYFDEAERLREAAGRRGRPRDANGGDGITLTKEVNAAAVKIIDDARASDGYLGERFDGKWMESRRKLGKWCNAIAKKLKLPKFTPSQLARRNEPSGVKWDELKQMISAMKF